MYCGSQWAHKSCETHKGWNKAWSNNNGNLQLCIANDFEQFIEEKSSKFYQIVRKIYDTYGYPLSKHITTPLCSDIVYGIMKPPEGLFLIRPKTENDIAEVMRLLSFKKKPVVK